MGQGVDYGFRSGGRIIAEVMAGGQFHRLLSLCRRRTGSHHRRPRPGQGDDQQQDQQTTQVLDHGGAAF